MRPLCSLTVPPDPHHASLVRSCLRDLVDFPDDDTSSSFLIAVTEVFVNAVQASLRQPRATPVTVQVWGPPAQRVTIVDHAGGIKETREASVTLGLGLTVARMFVPTLRIEPHATGTSVVLSLDTP